MPLQVHVQPPDIAAKLKTCTLLVLQQAMLWAIQF